MSFSPRTILYSGVPGYAVTAQNCTWSGSQRSTRSNVSSTIAGVSSGKPTMTEEIETK